MAIAAPVIEWNPQVAENHEYQFPIPAPVVSLNLEQQRKLTEAVRGFIFDDIRRCLAGDAALKQLGLTYPFIAGYLLAEGSIKLTEAGQFKISPTTTFKGASIDEVFIDHLKIHSYIQMVGRLGFEDIADRIDELWMAAEEEHNYNSINTTSLKNAVAALTMKRWEQRPAIVVERNGTVAVKWSKDIKSLLMAFLPDGSTWYKFKYGEERIVETRRAHDALSFAETMLSDF